MIAPLYDDVRTKVIDLTKGKVLVGHALWNDLAVCFTLVSVNPTFDRFLCFQVLNLCWNLDNVRDTALYYPLRKQVGIDQEGMYPSLKVLAEKVLGRLVQVGEHSSVSGDLSVNIPQGVRHFYSCALLLDFYAFTD